MSLLEERRAGEAVEEIFRCARSASVDTLARFLLSCFELEPRGVEFARIEEVAWELLGVPLSLVHQADRRPEWACDLGNLISARPGLSSHMRENYPELTRRLFEWQSEEGEG